MPAGFSFSDCFLNFGRTIGMTVISTLLAYLIGLPLGVFLAASSKKRNIIPHSRVLNVILSFLVNVIRSIPCLIIVIICFPFTRSVFGIATGEWYVILIPLFVASFAYVARMVQQSLDEVSSEKLEAIKSLGASNFQLITKVLIPESLPSLITGLSVSMICILGYTSFAYDIGAGGLIAYIWQFYTKNTSNFMNQWVFWFMIILVVLLVQLIQELGLYISKKIDKRRFIK